MTYLHGKEDGLQPDQRTQVIRPLPQAPLLGESLRDRAKLQARIDEANTAIERELAGERRDTRWIDGAAVGAFVLFLVLLAAVVVAQVVR